MKEILIIWYYRPTDTGACGEKVARESELKGLDGPIKDKGMLTSNHRHDKISSQNY